MADEADFAAQESDAHLAAAMKNAQNAGREVVPRGTCHNCEATVAGAQLFCDAECEQEWTAYRKRCHVARQSLAI